MCVMYAILNHGADFYFEMFTSKWIVAQERYSYIGHPISTELCLILVRISEERLQ